MAVTLFIIDSHAAAAAAAVMEPFLLSPLPIISSVQKKHDIWNPSMYAQ